MTRSAAMMIPTTTPAPTVVPLGSLFGARMDDGGGATDLGDVDPLTRREHQTVGARPSAPGFSVDPDLPAFCGRDRGDRHHAGADEALGAAADRRRRTSELARRGEHAAEQ